ncbi:MAG: sigma-70 family RNA polymerase sigma factor [Prevotellaceae bacterium]|nr:sigma-70 family RNA polymerase sigma factor [Prevotellaceae bacterium]MDY3856642.1 sigma-70 family RNA polymerase sigma factor [Bacteroidaceae bacterium]
MTPPDTDIQILAQLRDPATREQGFRTLTKRYGRRLYWHIRRIVVSHDDAEDALQETFIGIWSHLDHFRGDAGALQAWAYRIATREALQVLRRQTHLLQSIDSLSETLAEKLEAETSLNADRAATTFHHALLKLPTQQRIVFNLRYFDELTYQQIADITGKSVCTLKTNYHYATQRIRQYLKDHAT